MIFPPSAAMKSVATCLFALVVCGTNTATQSPVEKVVELLTKLKSRIEEEGKAEQKVYDKYACWCKETSTRKAGAIQSAQADLQTLGQSILKLKGKVAVLSSEIEELGKDIKKNLADQEEATAIRSKENAAYMAETSEMKQALSALQRALLVLGKATAGSSLLQGATSAGSAIQAAIEALPSRASVKPEQLHLLSKFMKSVSSSTYTPQSGTVQGILQDMYSTFSSDLESSTSTEASANRKFEDYMSTKAAELNQMKSTVEKKEGEKATAESDLADATQTYDDTEAEMKTNTAFFDETLASCKAKHAEWSTRAALRKNELDGINQAITILSSDEARELFSKAIKPGKEVGADTSLNTGVNLDSFLQVSSDASPTAKAYAKLSKEAFKTHSLRLAVLAAKVHEAKVGHFDKVIEAIDKLIATLKAEAAADIAKRDQCKDQYQKINSTVGNVNWLISKNKLKIEKLEGLIQLRTEEKANTVEEIQTVATQIDEMKKQRRQENQAFLQAKAEDQKAIILLKDARDALLQYYNKTTLGPIQGSVKGVFIQAEPFFNISEDQAPDASFSDKHKNKNEAKGIVSLLTMIMEDLNDEIRNDMKAEEAAQLQFESQLKTAEDLEAQLEVKKVNLEEMIAKRGVEKSDEQTLMANNKVDLDEQVSYKKQIKPDCDWIIGAFTKRASKRAAEMDGLVGAKEFLAGYQPAAAAGASLSQIRFLGMRA